MVCPVHRKSIQARATFLAEKAMMESHFSIREKVPGIDQLTAMIIRCRTTKLEVLCGKTIGKKSMSADSRKTTLTDFKGPTAQ